MPYQTLQEIARNPLEWLSKNSRLSRRLLSQVRHPAGNGIIVRDATFRVLLANDGAHLLFGLGLGRRYGLAVEAYFRPEVAQLITSLDSQVLESRQSVVAELPAGTVESHPTAIYRLTTTPVYREEGVLDGLVSVIVDQSELHLAEQNAYVNQQRYRRLFDSIPIPTGLLSVTLTSEGELDIRLLESNPPLMDLVGGHELPYERSAVEVWPAFRDTALLEGLAKMMSDGPVMMHEVFSSLLGRRLELNFCRVSSDRMMLFIVDVTERRQAEQHSSYLTQQMQGVIAAQHHRTEHLLDDANQFMSVVADRIDDATATLAGLAGALSATDAQPFGAVVQELQRTSEKMMRYASVGLLPTEMALHNVQQLLEELFAEMKMQFPFLEFEVVDVPSMLIPVDAFRAIVRNLIDHMCQLDNLATTRKVVARTLPKFLETGVTLEFHGFSVPYSALCVGDEGILVEWGDFNSLHLAAVRRLLAYHGRELWLMKGVSGSLNFVIRTNKKH